MGLMSWFWHHAPRSHETVWSSFHEEDGIHVIARELRRIAESLELLCNQRNLYEGGHIYDEVEVEWIKDK